MQIGYTRVEYIAKDSVIICRLRSREDYCTL